MVEAFHRDNIDVGIGLTESWVAGMARDHARSPMASKKEWQRFHIASTYVESPLRWALSTGGKRTDINNIQDLRHKNVGVSRIGRFVTRRPLSCSREGELTIKNSGSHIMSMVLADQHRWFDPSGSPPFQIVICGPFAELRDAVTRSSADFFMWEHYTTKKFWDTGELKRIGEIPTPWNGWHIAVRGSTPDPRVQEILYPSLQKGLEWFKNEKEEVMEMLTGEMGYERPDAESWYQEVVYPGSFGSINQGGVGAAITSLRTAGFIQSEEVALSDFTAAES